MGVKNEDVVVSSARSLRGAAEPPCRERERHMGQHRASTLPRSVAPLTNRRRLTHPPSCSTSVRITNPRSFGFHEHASEHVFAHTRLAAAVNKLLAARRDHPGKQLYGLAPDFHAYLDRAFAFTATSGASSDPRSPTQQHLPLAAVNRMGGGCWIWCDPHSSSGGG
jgi:hypothetical protein